MRMPSASFFQRSAFLLSSSSAVLEYMEKRGPELSPKLVVLAMAGVADSVLAAPGRLIFIKVCGPGEDMSKRQVKHTWIVPPFGVSLSGFRHRRDVWV